MSKITYTCIQNEEDKMDVEPLSDSSGIWFSMADYVTDRTTEVVLSNDAAVLLITQLTQALVGCDDE